jgi:hypothetical protein
LNLYCGESSNSRQYIKEFYDGGNATETTGEYWPKEVESEDMRESELRPKDGLGVTFVLRAEICVSNVRCRLGCISG